MFNNSRNMTEQGHKNRQFARVLSEICLYYSINKVPIVVSKNELFWKCTFKFLKIMDNEILLKLKQNMESETKVIKCQTKEKPIPKYNSQTGMWEIKMDGTRIILDF